MLALTCLRPATCSHDHNLPYPNTLPRASLHSKLMPMWRLTADPSHFPRSDAQVIVMARKPDFFNYNMSLYEVGGAVTGWHGARACMSV